ncbi:hypothetical protein HOK021_61410 [Streptomyces hygroscopicus]|nr:hypothetical protein HOK021_61410 [Streptomyces hygroscopicus]
MPGMKDATSPAVTRTSGAGTGVRRASPAIPVLPATRKNSGITAIGRPVPVPVPFAARPGDLTWPS